MVTILELSSSLAPNMNATVLFVLTSILIVSISLITQGAKRKSVVYFKKLEIENHYEELLQIDYNMNCTSQNISTIYVKIKLAEDIEKFTGTFNLRIRNGGKYVNFGNQEFDCNGMSMIYSHYLIQMVAVNLRDYSNFPLSCPFKKNEIYYINGFKIVTDVIPSYLPELPFTTDAKLFYNGRLVIHVKTEGLLSRKNI